jgi:alkylation response protein AidB-like acyl-CoA dehydrogenase
MQALFDVPGGVMNPPTAAARSPLDPRRTPLAELEALRALALVITSRADECESARRLPDDLAAELARAGLFRIMVPAIYGGPELHPIECVRVIEEVSRLDGSVGWCVMIGATTALLAGYLPERWARSIYSDPMVITCGATAPTGRARIVDGGYEVSGRWPWGSCVHNGRWITGVAQVFDGDAPRLLGDQPEQRLMVFEASDVEILDTWNVSGLRGTGSHDFRVERAFVPADRSIVLGVTPPVLDGPLYRIPIITSLGYAVCAVALGIARRAIEELLSLGAHKAPAGSRRTLLEITTIQERIGEAEARLRSARAFLFEALDGACSTLAAGDSLSTEQRCDLRVAAANAAWQSAAAVDIMYNAGGGSSIHSTSPLQRCFRDVHVATQHQRVSPFVIQQAGRLYAGLGEPPVGF